MATGRRRHQPNPALELAQQLDLAKIDGWVTEHRFHPERQWRFDFAWPAILVAVEVEGQVHGRPCTRCGKMLAGGRHTRGKGFEADCVKYNEAMRLGWRVIRVTGDMIRRGQAFALIQDLVDNGRHTGAQLQTHAQPAASDCTTDAQG